MGVSNGDTWVWRRHIFNREASIFSDLMLMLTHHIPCNNVSDSLQWLNGPNDRYKAKSFTELFATSISARRLEDDIIMFIRQKVSPPFAEVLA